VGNRPVRHPVNWSAAVYGGFAAGILATLAQIALWSVFADSLPTIFFRDARFTAAIVMGRTVLSPPASVDWPVMLVATLIHFALSIAYGLILARLISSLRNTASLLAGAAFGLSLYAVNMYGFTIVFPWFEAARDWITVAAHLVFGITAAGVYKMCSQRRHAGADDANGYRRRMRMMNEIVPDIFCVGVVFRTARAFCSPSGKECNGTCAEARRSCVHHPLFRRTMPMAMPSIASPPGLLVEDIGMIPSHKSHRQRYQIQIDAGTITSLTTC
jgi:hypothetical protein